MEANVILEGVARIIEGSVCGGLGVHFAIMDLIVLSGVKPALMSSTIVLSVTLYAGTEYFSSFLLAPSPDPIFGIIFSILKARFRPLYSTELNINPSDMYFVSTMITSKNLSTDISW